MKRRDQNRDGMVEVVTFGDYEVEGVLLDDYEAAMSVAGKGAYKNMSVQEILGVAHNVDISPENADIHYVPIDEVQPSNPRDESLLSPTDNRSVKHKINTNATTGSVSFEEAIETAFRHAYAF